MRRIVIIIHRNYIVIITEDSRLLLVYASLNFNSTILSNYLEN